MWDRQHTLVKGSESVEHYVLPLRPFFYIFLPFIFVLFGKRISTVFYPSLPFIFIFCTTQCKFYILFIYLQWLLGVCWKIMEAGRKNGATLVFFILFDDILCYINIRMTVSNRLKLIGDIGELIVSQTNG